MNINSDLMKAARAYAGLENGRVSMVYGDYYYRVEQEKKWGKEAWKKACDKVRKEYRLN